MKWLLIAAIAVAVMFLAVLIFGWLQPVHHSVTRKMYLHQTPEAVFAVLENSADLPTWSSAVLKVEPLPERDHKPAARITLRWGSMVMIMTQLERIPPNRLVTRMAKDNGPVLGTWTYEIAPETGGCRVSVTEEGELKNPLFRAIARLRGLDSNINQTLRDLAKKFGESADANSNEPGE